MARPINYDRWNNIEISDDEDDTHPNIDTPSLFKWRHESRLQRQSEFQSKREAVDKEKQKVDEEIQGMKAKLADSSLSESDLAIIKKGLSEKQKVAEEADKKQSEIAEEEKKMAWNVDTISKDGFSKTILNKPMPRRSNEDMTEEEREENMRQFVKKNEEDLKEFGWLKKFDDSKSYLIKRPHLACEESANYLVIHCLNLAMMDKLSAMEQVAHQCICIQYLLELSRRLDVDPRSCISSFFTKIQVADPEYKKAFEDELVAFKDRIRRRAKEKLDEQLEEARQEEEQERKERLGPGGLDPVEVFESLPEDLKECFQNQDQQRLQEVIRSLPESEARYHMKRCVDSGMWKPAVDDPDTNPEDGFRKRTETPDPETTGQEEEGQPENDAGKN